MLCLLQFHGDPVWLGLHHHASNTEGSCVGNEMLQPRSNTPHTIHNTPHSSLDGTRHMAKLHRKSYINLFRGFSFYFLTSMYTKQDTGGDVCTLHGSSAHFRSLACEKSKAIWSRQRGSRWPWGGEEAGWKWVPRTEVRRPARSRWEMLKGVTWWIWRLWRTVKIKTLIEQEKLPLIEQVQLWVDGEDSIFQKWYRCHTQAKTETPTQKQAAWDTSKTKQWVFLDMKEKSQQLNSFVNCSSSELCRLSSHSNSSLSVILWQLCTVADDS